MPEHIIKYNTTGRFLQFNDASGEVKFVSATDATGFPSAHSAWEKTREAAARLQSAKPDAEWIKIALGSPGSPAPDLSQWPTSRHFSSQSRPSLDDIAGVMELTYVRSASLGWLCRNWRKGQGPSLVWEQEFTFAVAFPDAESARVARDQHGGRDASLFKTSSVFVAVESAPEAGAEPDPVRGALMSAFEARELRGEIEKGAQERLEAARLARQNSPGPQSPSASASASPSKPRGRFL